MPPSGPPGFRGGVGNDVVSMPAAAAAETTTINPAVVLGLRDDVA
ncbi:hypothetical protein [Rhodococcus sp. ARC_M6]|nr:hypothetical protein [Rhodococcus sp. ARC_M6]